MTRWPLFFLSFLLLMPPSLKASQRRLYSDFELKAALEQLSSAHDPSSRIAAHLNLGDVEKSRGNAESSRKQFSSAATLTRMKLQGAE